MKRHLGIDFGSKRIGIALSDPLNIIASAFDVIPATDRAVEKIKQLVELHDVEAVIVGMPFNLKGEKGQKAEEVDRFIQELERSLAVRVIPWDERFTSTRVHQTMRELGLKKRQRQSREHIDSMAAALILQSYLDSRKQ